MIRISMMTMALATTMACGGSAPVDTPAPANNADVHADKSEAHGHDREADAQADKHEAVYACPMHPEITSHEPAKCSECGMDLVKKDEAAKEAVVYACPMHPDERAHEPGKCSKCGMDLVEQKAHDHAGHDH